MSNSVAYFVLIFLMWIFFFIEVFLSKSADNEINVFLDAGQDYTVQQQPESEETNRRRVVTAANEV